jgi:hypothetical protein
MSEIIKIDKSQSLSGEINNSVEEVVPNTGSIIEMGKFAINRVLPESEIEARIISDQRIRLEIESGIDEPISVHKTVEFLKQHQISDTEKFFCEFEISEKITPDEIRELLTLPFEVAITEQNEKVILTTGTAHNAGVGDQYIERRDHSRLSFHTHPIRENIPSTNTPSFSDIYITDFADEDTPLIVAAEDGIIVYAKPEKGLREAREVMLEYCDKKGVDIFNFRSIGRKYEDLSVEERLTLQRQFAEDTGVIVEEASWDNPEGIAKIMGYINLQRVE